MMKKITGKKTKKRLALLTLICAAGIGAAVPGIKKTSAYLTDNESYKNITTVGNVDISIDEFYREYTKAQPGVNIYTKSIRLKNKDADDKSGSIDAYARVRLQFSSKDIENVSYFSNDDGNTWYGADDYKNHLPEGWEYIDGSSDLGGYYYYTKPLKPGEETTPLISMVKTNFSGNNIYRQDNEELAPEQNDDTNGADVPDVTSFINSRAQDYDIDVYAEGVQAKDLDTGNTMVEDYKTAWTTFLSRK